MTEQEIQELKVEALAKHEQDISKFKQGDETVECLYSDGWTFSDIREFILLGRIRHCFVSIARLASKPRTVCLILIAAITFESVHFHAQKEETRTQFIQEYSNFDGWTHRAAENAATPLIYEFVEIPRPAPHVPEEEFQAPPRTTMYAQLTGSSAAVSGQYYQ